MLSLPLEGEPSTVALEGNLLRTACAFIESEGALVGLGGWKRAKRGARSGAWKPRPPCPWPTRKARMAAIEFVDGESARVIVAENEAGFFPLEANPLSAPVHSEGAGIPHKAARQPTWPRKPRAKLPRPSAPTRPGFRAMAACPVR